MLQRMDQTVLNIHIIRPHPYKESHLTCPRSSLPHLLTRLAPAKGLLATPMELSRSGLKDIRILLDQRLRVVCTLSLAILEPPTRPHLRRTTIRPVILMLQ